MPSTQDFLHGIDFTGINPATGADHNSLVDLAVPGPNAGIVITTQDTALDTPDVPDAVTIDKWKRYIWKRIPFISATNLTPIFYSWNDNITSDPIFLKWMPAVQDLSDINAQITDLETEVGIAQSTANAANTLAGQANNTAIQAKTDAATATTNAATATTAAAKASADAQTAINTANDAKELAQDANDAIAGKRSPESSLTPGSAGQFLRTSLVGNPLVAEWFDGKDNYGMFTEEYGSGTGAGAIVAGANIRKLNTDRSLTAPNPFFQLNADGSISILKTGNYSFQGACTLNSIPRAQLTISRNNVNFAFGISRFRADAPYDYVITVSGLANCNSGDTITLVAYSNAPQATGAGRAANLGVAECFAYLEITRL